MLTHPSGTSARFQTTFHFDSRGALLRAAFGPPKIVSAVGRAALRWALSYISSYN